MASFENREAVAAKIAWEGGWTDALEYGITADAMPPGDTELRTAWDAVDIAYAALKTAWAKVDRLLPEMEAM